MRYIYTSDNAAEAHMLSHLLEQHGVMAQVHGEFLQSGAGEIATPNCIKLSVIEHDYSKARDLLKQWEQKNPPDPKMQHVSMARHDDHFFKNIMIFGCGCLTGALFTSGFLGYTISDIIKLISG